MCPVDRFPTRGRNVRELQGSEMPKLHYPDRSLGELQEILKASQDEVNRRGLQPLALRLQLSQQAGVCGWLGGGYLIRILYLKGEGNKKNCLNIKQIPFSGRMFWAAGRCSNLR